MMHIDLLEERGDRLAGPYTRQLDGKLRELRFYCGGRAIRISYWIAPGRRIVMFEARRARPITPEIRREYAAARLRFELGEAVRDRRAVLGLSQRELAERATMTQSAVARFEAGGTVPTLALLSRLADALDLDLTVAFTPHVAEHVIPPADQPSFTCPTDPS